MESDEIRTAGATHLPPNVNEDWATASSSGNSTAVTALEELQELYVADPDVERVSLRGRRLSQTEAETALRFLQTHFPRLRHLDLRDNELHELPGDFGLLMPKLVALDLSNNRFRFRLGALRTLAETLQRCACLKSLSLSLSSPAEEQLLLAMLPRLRILNGTPLPSTRLSSQGNPASPTIQELQLLCASPPKAQAKGPRRSVKNSVRPREVPASISDDRTDWCKLLKLDRWHASTDAGSSPSALRSSSTASVSTETFLSQLKAVVKAFHECDALAKSSKGSKLKLFAQLDRHVELLAQQLKRQEPSDGKTELSEAMLQTRWSLLEVCAMFGSQKAAQAHAGLGGGFEILLAMQKQVLAAMQQQQQRQAKPSVSASDSSSTPSQSQLKLLLDVAENLENDLEAAQLELQQETARRELAEQENWALKHGSSRAPKPQDSRLATSASRRIRKRNGDRESAILAEEPRPVETPTPLLTANSSAPEPPVTLATRSLTLKQLVDLVNSVYASKAKYDTRTTDAGAPRETMEQHLYTYLNTRFGLPKLIVEYASAVWKAAERFALRENDAAVFVALLRNRLDEGFLDIKRKLQRALVELLRAFFAAKYPRKQGQAIAALVQNRLDSLLLEEEWRNLLTYLYEPQDVRSFGSEVPVC
ncbi:hypothetical protein BBJ28_00004258 [Nothophytophthora sp. Chile5]|nr:hypothetical protein BBJ28_00004258 [Nothophytophthora sp. Chile5]